jgi:outer membrane protein OmpA-like peptidoglycan-associated protein
MRLFFTLLLFCFALAPVRAQNFRVQAAAFAAPVAPAYFKDRGVEGVIGSTDANGIYRYFVGNYATLEAAEAARDLLVAKGFPNATVIDLAVQRALYESPCTYFAGNPMGAASGMGMNVSSIYFESGVASLSAEAKQELDRYAGLLRDYPELKLSLTGHTDALGNAQSNVELATTRTRAARDYLIARGVRADRMFLNVAGEAQPAMDNQDFYGNDLPKNRRWNRRVVLAILKEGGEIEPENR